MNIRNKILVGVLIVLIISISLIGVISINLSSSALFFKIKDNTILLAESYANELNLKLANYKKVTKNLSRMIISSINIENLLIEKQRLYPELSNLFYTDANGNLLEMYPYNKEFVDIDFSQKDYWKSAKETFKISVSDISNEFGYNSLILTAPVFIYYNEETTPDLQGFVSVSISTEDLFKNINNVVIGNTGSIFVINDTGTILTHKNKSFILNKKFSELGEDNNLKRIQNQLTEQNTGSSRYQLYSKEYFVSFAPIPEKRWSLGVNGLLEEFTQDIDKLIFIILIVLLVSILSIIIIIYLIVRKITNPISSLINTIKEMQNGNLSARTQVNTKDEIGKLANAFDNMAIELKSSFDKIKDYNEHLEEMVNERTKEIKEKNKILLQDLKMAQKVQRTIIPANHTLPRTKELKFGSLYIALESIGGDLFDVIKLNDDKYSMFIGDVSGHGVPAALISTMAKTIFNSKMYQHSTTEEICKTANNELYQLIGDLDYDLTAFFAIFDLKQKTLQFTNAAHHPAYLYRRTTNEVIELDEINGYMGLMPNIDFTSSNTSMQNGDKMLLFTDGLIEIENSKGEFYDVHRLKKFIQNFGSQTPTTFVEGLIKDVENFSGGHPKKDDIAILCMDYIIS